MTFRGWPFHLSHLFHAVDVPPKEWNSATPDCSCCQRASAAVATGGIASLMPFHFQVTRSERFRSAWLFNAPSWISDSAVSRKTNAFSSRGRIATWRKRDGRSSTSNTVSLPPRASVVGAISISRRQAFVGAILFVWLAKFEKLRWSPSRCSAQHS